jgi:hypothetical protein
MQVPNIEDVAHWLGSPPEEVEEIGFEQAGGGVDGMEMKSLRAKPAPQTVIAKVLKVILPGPSSNTF